MERLKVKNRKIKKMKDPLVIFYKMKSPEN